MSDKIISMKKNEDGTISVFYFGKETGFMRCLRDTYGRPLYKALRNVDNSIRNCSTVEAAREFLLEKV